MLTETLNYCMIHTSSPTHTCYLKQEAKIALDLIVTDFLHNYVLEFICHSCLPCLLLCLINSKYIALKEINLKLKLKGVKEFCFPFRRFRYICIYIFFFLLLSSSFQQSPVYVAISEIFYFELINTDLIWHGLVFSWWRDVRSCQSWFHFLKTIL